MVGKVANTVVYLKNNLFILFNKFLGYGSPTHIKKSNRKNDFYELMMVTFF